MKNIAIIGAGNMGGAIARGLCSKFAPETISVSDVNEASLQALKTFNSKIQTSTSNAESIKGAKIILLAVKPWLVEPVILSIKNEIDYDNQIFISIAAGVSFEKLKSYLAKDEKLPVLFRLIPNTAIDVKQSVTSIAALNASKEQSDMVLDIFNSLGKAFLVTETQLNAVMALSSCGIAYAFRYIRAAQEGAVELGLYPEMAKNIVMQTLRGAIELLEANGSHPEQEIDKVTTPGGITIKGLNAMEQNGFTNAVIEGLKASYIK